MKKLMLMLVALAASLMVLMPSAGAVGDSPVICDEHPTQPWLCAPLDGSIDDYNYLSGANFGADSFDDSTLDAYAFGTEYESSLSGTSTRLGFGTVTCPFRARVRQISVGGTRWVRGRGIFGTCSPPQPRVNLITVCLLRSVTPASFVYQLETCHPKSNVGPYLEHSTYKRCRGTTSYHWRSEVILNSTYPYWTPIQRVLQSPTSTFACS